MISVLTKGSFIAFYSSEFRISRRKLCRVNSVLAEGNFMEVNSVLAEGIFIAVISVLAKGNFIALKFLLTERNLFMTMKIALSGGNFLPHVPTNFYRGNDLATM